MSAETGAGKSVWDGGRSQEHDTAYPQHSLSAQGQHRIDSRRPTRWDIAGNQGNHKKQKRNAAVCHRVSRADTEKQACHKSGEHRRSYQSNDYTQAGYLHSFADDQSKNIYPLGTECHANAHLLCSLCHQICHHTINAYAGQYQGQGGEPAQQSALNSPL
jgi:hypothetical protein